MIWGTKEAPSERVLRSMGHEFRSLIIRLPQCQAVAWKAPNLYISKARIRTNHADKEEQASQIYHDSLAFGAKSFPDLHLAICQVPSAVGDLVSSLKVGLKPPGSKPQCLHCRHCCNDVEPEPTMCWGIWTVWIVIPQRYGHIAVSSSPACQELLAMVMERRIPRKLSQSMGSLFAPTLTLSTAPGRRKREKRKVRGEEQGPSITASDGTLLLVAKLNQEYHTFYRWNAATNAVSFPLPQGMLLPCRAWDRHSRSILTGGGTDETTFQCAHSNKTLQDLLEHSRHYSTKVSHHEKREYQKSQTNVTSQSPLYLHWFIHPCNISNRPRHEESRKLHDDDVPLRLCFPSACQAKIYDWQWQGVHKVWADPLVKL